MLKKRFLILPVAIALAACGSDPTSAVSPASSPRAGATANNICMVPVANVLTSVDRGYDQYGYNRCARVFNGTYAGWCLARGAPADCAEPAVASSTALLMKWNAEWDRGNAESWTLPPYDAWLDNETKGTSGGVAFTEHFKTKWDAGCVANGTATGGGDCIWGQFAILMDQGKWDGVHVWWSKMTPAGYGN